MSRPWEWSEGKHLTDTLLEMGFLGSDTSFKKRFALAEYLDAYFERAERERKEQENHMEKMMRMHNE